MSDDPHNKQYGVDMQWLLARIAEKPLPADATEEQIATRVAERLNPDPLIMPMHDFYERFIAPAARALAEKIDADALAELEQISKAAIENTTKGS